GVSIGRASGTELAYNTYAIGDPYDRWTVNASGLMLWGSGSAAQDTSLYRSGASELSTGGALIVNADNDDTLVSLYVDGTASPAIQVGNATNLGYVTVAGYWSDQSTTGDSVLRAGDGDL